MEAKYEGKEKEDWVDGPVTYLFTVTDSENKLTTEETDYGVVVFKDSATIINGDGDEVCKEDHKLLNEILVLTSDRISEKF